MSAFLAELSSVEILSEQAVLNIRRYISEKNPSLPSHVKAGIFADAINRILNDRLPRLPEEQIKSLKASLFKATAGKQAFCINGSDIFKATLELKTIGHSFFTELDRWLGEMLHRPVARKEVFELVINTRKLMDAYPEMNMENILEISEKKPVVNVPEAVDIQKAVIIPETVIASEAAIIPETSIVPEPPEEICVPGNTESRCEVILENEPPTAVIRTEIFPALLRPWLLKGKKFAAAAACIVVMALSLVYFSGTYANAAKTDSVSLQDGTAPGAVSGSLPAGDIPDSAQVPEPENKIIKMKATAYDLSFESTGKRRGDPQYGITFSGTKASAGRTIAVDPSVIPLGSSVKITFPEKYRHMDGIYIAEDTGRLIKGNSIDVFFGEDKPGRTEVNKRALEFGVQYVEVEIKK